MQAIHLKQGIDTIVDDQDYHRFCDLEWHFSNTGYAIRWIRDGGKLQTQLLHREIMNAQPGQLVDHRDGNTLNNTRANLRLVTPMQNGWNRRANRGSTYKGVCWHKQHQQWQVRIQAYGHRVSLGLYDDPQQAAKIYDAASHLLHGEFAKLNFPEQPIDPMCNVIARTYLNHIFSLSS